jgi:hypothetical protein
MKIIIDLKYKTFSLDLTDLDPLYNYFDLKFLFVSEGEKEVIFDNLNFEYTAFYEDIVLNSETYPPKNIQYVSSGQEYLELSRVPGIRPNKEYRIDVLVNHSNESFSDSIIFKVPKLNQPYESWIWNDELIEWESPIPYPEDENFYTWNEEDQAWNIFIPEEES